jgi:hypothetical protein
MGVMTTMKTTQVVLMLGFVLCLQPCYGQWSGREAVLAEVEKTFGDPPGMTRLDPNSRVWASRQTGRVVVDGYIALQDGPLEMFACPVGTKEHESVVAVFSKAQVIHAALLAVGAKPGTPVKWDPKYEPPTGSEIQVMVLWKDKEGNKRIIDAREWVREMGTADSTLDVNFVFAGSSFWKDPDTGKEHYQAESGDLICVSNFSTAMLDVPIESSKVNSGLMFATFTDRIPERETPVRLVLQVLDKKRTSDARSDAASPATTATPLDEIRRPAIGPEVKRPAVPDPPTDGDGAPQKKRQEDLQELIRDP